MLGNGKTVPSGDECDWTRHLRASPLFSMPLQACGQVGLDLPESFLQQYRGLCEPADSSRTRYKMQGTVSLTSYITYDTLGLDPTTVDPKTELQSHPLLLQLSRTVREPALVQYVLVSPSLDKPPNPWRSCCTSTFPVPPFSAFTVFCQIVDFT